MFVQVVGGINKVKVILKCSDKYGNEKCDIKFTQTISNTNGIKDTIREFVISRVSTVTPFMNECDVFITLDINGRKESTQLTSLGKGLTQWLDDLFPYGESLLTTGDVVKAFKGMPKSTPVFIGEVCSEYGEHLGCCMVAESKKKTTVVSSSGAITSKTRADKTTSVYGKSWTLDRDGIPVRIFGI